VSLGREGPADTRYYSLDLVGHDIRDDRLPALEAAFNRLLGISVLLGSAMEDRVLLLHVFSPRSFLRCSTLEVVR
jgi:hypothetical protein